ncbi:MAG: permease [Actinobacteria bacterium]|nr:permease [Actinomycetota bacterium]
MSLPSAPPTTAGWRTKERWTLALILLVFGAAWFLPVGSERFWGAVRESLALVHWYAREHVLLCLIPAFFIAGAIAVFVSRGAVLKYLGPQAKKTVAYPVAAVSGGILAVCSCTVLPLFASIHKRGAGLGPATAFLYSGPAINVLAIILTARILGFELGLVRAVGAIVFAVVIGLLMHLIFLKEERSKSASGPVVLPDDGGGRALWQEGVFFLAMVGILVFANWGRPEEGATGMWAAVHSARWIITAGFGVLLLYALASWFQRREMRPWVEESWGFAKLILPLLLAGVLVAGFLLGGPDGGDGGIIPSSWVERSVGGNSLGANLFASVAGAFMYFATLTEVPILEGLINSGMGKGPALALLLAGPALSLPNMLVIRTVMGTRKTMVFVSLVVAMSTVAGLVYGAVA